MNAKEVVDKILAEAEAEAKAIRSEAKAKFSEEDSRFSSQLAGFNKETENLAAIAETETVSRMLATARMDNRKKNLVAKTGLLDKVFSQAGDSLRSLGDADYRSFISSLLVKSSESGREEVIVGRDESRIDQALIEDANSKLSGGKGSLVLSDSRADIDGGFILRMGNVRINVSVDVMVSQAREVLEIEFAEKLFG